MTRLLRPARILLAVYSVLLAIALFSPSSDRQSGMVGWLSHNLATLGVPGVLIQFDRLEVVMNAAIIVPVTLLGTFIRPSASWRDWTAFAFVAAVSVEAIQGLLLPGRQASYSDVVANTAGALVGALLGAVLIRLIGPMLRSRTTA